MASYSLDLANMLSLIYPSSYVSNNAEIPRVVLVVPVFLQTPALDFGTIKNKTFFKRRRLHAAN